jgi:hypothetical protein
MIKQPPGGHFEFPISAKLLPDPSIAYVVIHSNMLTQYENTRTYYVITKAKNILGGYFEFSISAKLYPNAMFSYLSTYSKNKTNKKQ